MNRPIACFQRWGARFALLGAWLGLIASAWASAPIIFVQAPAGAIDLTEPYSPQARYVDGCRIVRLVNGDIQTLTDDFESALDPEISFDGAEMLFTARRAPGDAWSLWRMNLGDLEAHPIQTGVENAISPRYAGSLFHLNDASPTLRLIFAAPDARANALALFACGLDGSGVQRITSNMGDDCTPALLPNGRVVYSSRTAFPGARDAFSLLAVNIDGTDGMAYAIGAGFTRYAVQPAASSNETLYFIESDSPDGLGGGALASVSQQRPMHSKRLLSDDGTFLDPCAIDEGALLVSHRRDGDEEPYALLTMDADEASWSSVFASHEWHCFGAAIQRAHAAPSGRSSVVNIEKDAGEIYCLNVYESQLPDVSGLQPGSIKQVRVLTAAPETGAAWLLGDAPVEEDGSFHLLVPANSPLAFQLLDSEGNTVATQAAWTWVRPGERRGCIGCHEDPELAPPNRLVQAVTKPPVKLLTPASRVVLEGKEKP
ncbi:MAG: hypothetical protein GC154_16000 [bacterium]|nr:hypothetical protein [bacterium]